MTWTTLEWAAKNKESIIHNLNKASRNHERRKERETPIGLLEEAYKKLTHDNMNLSAINNCDLPEARRIVSDIIKRAHLLDSDIYHHEKNYKNLAKKKKS